MTRPQVTCPDRQDSRSVARSLHALAVLEVDALARPVGEAGAISAVGSGREHGRTVLELRALARAVGEAGGIKASGGRHVGIISRTHVPAHTTAQARERNARPQTHKGQ